MFYTTIEKWKHENRNRENGQTEAVRDGQSIADLKAHRNAKENYSFSFHLKWKFKAASVHGSLISFSFWKKNVFLSVIKKQ